MLKAASAAHLRTGEWRFASVSANPLREEELFRRDFRILGSIGAGDSGDVQGLEDRKSGKHYAMKIISNDMLEKHPEKLEAVEREIRLQSRLSESSDDIVRIHKSFRKVNGDFVIMTELMPDGELVDKLGAKGGLDDSWDIRDTFRQISDGLRFCHDHDVVHLDIKPQNIWCEDKKVKIGDFGAAMKVQGKTRLFLPPGSPRYMAPELARKWLGGSHRDELVDLKAADVWTLGVTFYVLLAGRFPWVSSQPVLDVFGAGYVDEKGFDDVYVPLPSSVDRDLDDLIAHMLQRDPSKRYIMEQVSSHRFFKRSSSLKQAATGSGVAG
jgi:serine/threonine protein kinase